MNIAGAGLTPFMAAAEPDNVPTVEYFLDHGGDVTKTDDKGCTVLHHAAGTGCCKVTEFLLTKGLPVSIDCDLGTPLFHAANNGKDKTLKILLDHQADLGWLPVEHVALHDFREEVEMLFPLTSPIQNVPEWSINGIISHAKFKDTKPMDMESKDEHHEKPTTSYGDKPPNVSSVMKKTQVFVKHPHGTLSLQIDTNKDVEFLREEVEQRMQLDISGYFFMYDLSTIEAGKPLSSYGIEKDSNICMRARLHGGRRFHGGRKLHHRKRFHGQRKSKTLSQFYLKHGEEEFLKTVKLPDGSKEP
uniref:Ubiquitin-like domain-containing protein n=2 Tax=Oryza meridionalis TaxID=40149 RepID=A0A0E0BXW4_9ORYZ